MARPKSFDHDAVLTGAMHAFRQHGYARLSIRDLEQATGLVAGSIYNSFGDKGGLFAAAFAHYLKAILLQRIDTHAPSGKGLDGVRKLFATLLEEPRNECFGCLITNTAVEFGATGADQQRLVQSGFEILREALLASLTAAQQTRALHKGIDPAIAAIKLVALYQGVLVMVRAGYDKASLRKAIDLEFDALAA